MSFDINAEIEAITNLVSLEGSEDDKISAVLDFNKEFFTNLGFSFSIQGVKEKGEGFKAIGSGYLEDDLQNEISLMLSAPDVILSLISGEKFNPLLCMKFVADIKTLTDARLKEEAGDALKNAPEGLKDLIEQLKDMLGGQDD